jgi:hypothetical protein
LRGHEAVTPEQGIDVMKRTEEQSSRAGAATVTALGVELRTARLRVPQHVVYRAFPAETVALNLETEQYHGLNPTAGRMLAALDRTGSVPRAAREVANEFAQPLGGVERDIVNLCERLLERGLIELVAA